VHHVRIAQHEVRPRADRSPRVLGRVAVVREDADRLSLRRVEPIAERLQLGELVLRERLGREQVERAARRIAQDAVADRRVVPEGLARRRRRDDDHVSPGERVTNRLGLMGVKTIDASRFERAAHHARGIVPSGRRAIKRRNVTIFPERSPTTSANLPVAPGTAGRRDTEDGRRRAARAASRVFSPLRHNGRARRRRTRESRGPPPSHRHHPSFHHPPDRQRLFPTGSRRRSPGRPVPDSGRPRRRRPAADQIRERDWQPSTGTHAPLIQLALGETRNATTDPTSSGRPNRPKGNSRATKSAMPAGSSC